MKTLELKHIAPYLPYGLNVTFEGDDYIHEVVGLSISSKGVELISPFGDYGRADIEDCRLILRPLSDIHKEIVHNGKKVYPWREVNKLLNGEYNADYNNIEVNEYGGLRIDFGDHSSGYDLRESYEVVQLLLEYHFDIFGLLDDGLAIDINELNNK